VAGRLPLVLIGLVLLAPSAAASSAGTSAQPEKIVFISTRAGDRDRYGAEHRDLFALDPSDGRIARITTGADPVEFVVSHDGSRVAFESDASAVYVVGSDGRGLRQIPECKQSASFSPDGRQVACSGRNGQVLVVDLEGGGVRQLAASADSLSLPVWSPDGRLIAFGNKGLSVVEAAGGTPRRLTARNALWTTWSPDSNQIAFVSGGLYVIDVDGGHVRQVLPDSSYSSEPAWSPDGRIVAVATASDAFLCHACPGTVVLVDAATGARRPVAAGTHPSWSPDGTSIAYTSVRVEGVDEGDITAIRVDGTSPHALTAAFPDGGSNYDPSWVPGTVQGAPPRPKITVARLVPRRELSVGFVDDFAVDGWLVGVPGCTLWDVHSGRVSHPPACTGEERSADEVAVAGNRFSWLHYSCSCITWSYIDVRFADPPYRQARQAVFSAISNDDGSGERAADLRGDGGLLAFNIDHYLGETAAARELWAIPRSAQHARPCPDSSADRQESPGPGRFCVRLAGGDRGRVLDVDHRRVLVSTDAGLLILLRADGRVLRTWPTYGVSGAALTGDSMIVTTPTQLRVYTTASGKLLRVKPLASDFAPARVEDASGGFAVYVRGGAVHLVRLSDGRDVALYVPGQGAVVHARLEEPGLFYAYNKTHAKKPGRIAFVPAAELSKLMARGA
jgi:Tol biopolymer transport system component